MLTLLHLLLLALELGSNISRTVLVQNSGLVGMCSARYSEQCWLRRRLSARCSYHLVEELELGWVRRGAIEDSRSHIRRAVEEGETKNAKQEVEEL